MSRSERSPRIVRLIARLNVGGPAKHVVWLTRAAKEAGCDARLICGNVASNEDDMAYFARLHGVRPFKIGELGREISWRDVAVVWKLFWLFRKVRPDIIHTHTAKAGAVGRLAALLYRWLTPATAATLPRRCRVVHTYHGHVLHSYYGPLKTWLFRAIERLLGRLATHRIVVISQEQFREIHHDHAIGRASQFSIIPLGIDTDVFDRWQERRPLLRREIAAADDELLVGIVGRLTEIKNHRLFLLAASHFRTRHARECNQRVRFVVVGDGHLRAALEQQSQDLGLFGHVTFLGRRDDPERFYPALDIVALTSLNEGTPLSLIEAMANCRPVIATRVGGVPDLLGPENENGGRSRCVEPYLVCQRGVSVEPGQEIGFCDGLRRLIDDDHLRQKLGEAGRHFVLRHYQRSRLADDVLKLYRELLETS